MTVASASQGNGVAAVLLNWNGEDDTRQCVKALQSADPPPQWIVVIDNGSAPASVAAMRELQGVQLRELPENRGFSGGVNAGMEAAWALGASSAWLVNTDAVPAIDCLRQLLARAALLQAPALLSPIIFFSEEPERVQHYATVIDLRNGVVDELKGPAQAAAALGPDKRLLLWGAALWIPRAAAQAIGPFDEAMFAYGEDSDYCMRAHRCGVGVQYVDGARIWHGNPVTGPRRPHYYYYTARNVLHFNRRHFGWRIRLKLLYWHWGRLKGTWQGLGGLSEHRQALEAGLWHGLLGRGGAFQRHFKAPALIRQAFAARRG
jgi:GT2 family glycosyltransferase